MVAFRETKNLLANKLLTLVTNARQWAPKARKKAAYGGLRQPVK